MEISYIYNEQGTVNTCVYTYSYKELRVENSEHLYLQRLLKTSAVDSSEVGVSGRGAPTLLRTSQLPFVWKVKTHFTLLLMYGNFPYIFSNEYDVWRFPIHN